MYLQVLSHVYLVLDRWLYTLFIMVDANFKLKLKDKGIPDAPLGSGWAYFVEDSQFKSYLEDHSEDQTEVSFLSLSLAVALI